MTLEIAGLLALTIGLISAFLAGRISPDVVALCMLLLLVFGGFLSPEEAFSGFSSPATLTLIAMFIIGAGLHHSGLAEFVAIKICNWARGNERITVVLLMIVASLVSSFMNNVAAAALLMPSAAIIARRSNLPLSLLLLPLSIAVMLGGTLTLIGTTPNVLASQVLFESGLAPLGFLSFFPYGAALTVTGIGFIAIIGTKLLPRNVSSTQSISSENLSDLYRLYERIFSLRIPANSRLSGKSLSELQFGRSLDLGVVAIERAGKQILAPGPQQKLLAQDLLIVRGRVFELDELLKLRGISVQPIENLAEQLNKRRISTVAFKVPAGLSSKTLRQLAIREKFGFLVASIERNDELIFQELASEKLQEGDILHSIGDADSIRELSELLQLSEVDISKRSAKGKQGMLFSMRLPKGSPLAATSIRSSRLGELTGFTVVAMLRVDEFMLPVSPDELLKAEDVIIVAGDIEKARALSLLGELEIVDSQSPQAVLESEEIKLVEVVISPRSKMIGKTLEEIRFRERFNSLVLAMWHEGVAVRARLARTPLGFGDALLLQVPLDKMNVLLDDPDFVVLSERREEVKLRRSKIGFAILGLFIMFLIELLGLQDMQTAAWSAALVLILGGAVTMEEAYREIDWRTVILVAALLPVGLAFQKAGAVTLFTDSFLNAAGGIGPIGIIVCLAIVSSLISQTVDSTLAILMTAPIAISISQSMGLSPHLCVMACALSASNSFLASFSSRSNLLVMGPGAYKPRDYFKIGLPLTLIYLIVTIVALMLSDVGRFL